jgi:N-acetylmuramic acid 6-phosphate etherase
MVDLKMSNEKLRDRARRVVRAAVKSPSAIRVEDDEVLDQVLAECEGSVKLAIIVATLGCSPQSAENILRASEGALKRALDVDIESESSSN